MIKQFKRFIVVFLVSGSLGLTILTILNLTSLVNYSWLTGYLTGQLLALLVISTTFWGIKWQLKTLRKAVFVVTFMLKNFFYLIPFLILDFYATFVSVWGIIIGLSLGVLSNTASQCLAASFMEAARSGS